MANIEKVEMENQDLVTILSNQPAYILLARKPKENCFHGLVENSFMDWLTDRVCVFWTGKAYSILGEHDLDGLKDVQYHLHYYKNIHSDWDYWAGDARSEDCPVELDWWGWMDSRLRGDFLNHISAKFVMK